MTRKTCSKFSATGARESTFERRKPHHDHATCGRELSGWTSEKPRKVDSTASSGWDRAQATAPRNFESSCPAFIFPGRKKTQSPSLFPQSLAFDANAQAAWTRLTFCDFSTLKAAGHPLHHPLHWDRLGDQTRIRQAMFPAGELPQ